MRNEFIYDLMRSEEIREYYRKNVELDTEEQECVIINCYKSLKEKLELLKKLYDNVPEEDKNNVKEMITLYELVNTIYYNPYEFFGNDCRVIYALHYLKPLCNLLGVDKAVSNRNLFDCYSQYVEYFDNIEKMIEFMNVDECYKYNEPFEVDIIVIPNNGESLYYPIEYYCEYINGNFELINFTLDNKTDIFDKYNISETIHREIFSKISHKGLPFKSGDRIKVQTPSMDQPFYGIISSEQDYPIDPNSCWYNFVYEDGTNVEDFDKSIILLDLSYINIDNSPKVYAIFDWVERA